MSAAPAEILVAGGGTVGLAAATALAHAGFAVTVVERGAPPPAFAGGELDARVYALSPASVRFLDALGVWPEIRAARSAAWRGMAVWQDDPAQALRFEAPPDAPLGWIVEHGLLNAALYKAALAAGVGVRTQAEILGAQADEGAVHLQLAGEESLSAKLLLIADGPDSPLSAMLGLASLGWGYQGRALVCHAATEKPHGGIARQRFLATGPLALLPLADGRVSIVWSASDEFAAELAALDDAAFAQRLAAAAQYVLGAVTAVTPRRAFPLRLKHLDIPVLPGAVVIGDAAHVVHPLAGQGVNLGLADAEALAQTLMQAREAGRGWWRARTLAAYARARRADTMEMLALTDALHRGFVDGGPALARLLAGGMGALNRAAPLKHWLLARATG